MPAIHLFEPNLNTVLHNDGHRLAIPHEVRAGAAQDPFDESATVARWARRVGLIGPHDDIAFFQTGELPAADAA